MRFIRSTLLTLAPLLVLGACTDLGTLPSAPASPQLSLTDDPTVGENPPDYPMCGGTCVLPPVVVDGGCRQEREICEEPPKPEPIGGGPLPSDPGGGGGGGASIPTPGPEDEDGVASDCDPEAIDCEAESDICPQPLRGRTLPYMATIAGRNHQFRFEGTMQRQGSGRSPATYAIARPTASKDMWWIAESGTIQTVCMGRWIARRLWIGTIYVIGDDLHFVMGPNHPDF